ncbi:hypothetical protein BP6252_09649 [Coleophoma cylindrospora]|uniref:Uncharacterized protein n=1 Tax=Coleophoma cylindrospora TaxID=1849047 RepID=A0A3D8QWV1_9HELO|nr:hypothetical protein BP6252_09649 [Coleophoma cylindrospora]
MSKESSLETEHHFSSQHRLLESFPETDHVDKSPEHHEGLPRHFQKWKAFALGSMGLFLLSLILNISQAYRSIRHSRQIPYVYSPAEDAVEHHVVVFQSGFQNDRTPYTGPPSDAVDAAWDDLYNRKSF